MVAFLILAHTRPDQLLRLVRRLEPASRPVFVHVDQRVDVAAWPGWGELTQTGATTVRRRPSPWGAFGIVQATLEAIATALQSSSWTHLVVLTGQDYPIKPLDQIEAFYAGHAGESFVEHHRMPRREWGGDGGMSRLTDLHLWLGSRHLTVPLSRVGRPRQIPGGLQPYQGGACFSLSREAAELISTTEQTQPRLQRFFRHTLCSDESYFQTVLMNSPLAGRVVASDLRYEDWSANKSHPKTLTAEDLPALRAAEALYAKKFDTSVDAGILDLLDAQIHSAADARR